jgi:hypothetical protein
MSVTISITKDAATPRLLRLAALFTPQRLGASAGKAVEGLVARHLRSLGRNKKGWPSTEFWARAAKATHSQPHPEGTLVSVNQIGVRQRYLGGHISPVKARALTIPISPVAAGKTASDFPGSFLLKTKTGTYIAQHGEELYRSPKGKVQYLRGRSKNAGGNAAVRIQASLNLLFKLSSGVDQAPNPDVLPSREAISSTAIEAIRQDIKSSLR